MTITRRAVEITGLRDPITGELVTGIIKLVMPSALFDEDGNEVWRKATIPIDVTAGGGSAEVPPNDTAGVTPSGWAYGVRMSSGRSWSTKGSISVPSGVDALEFVPNFVAGSAPPSPGTSYVTTAALEAHAADTTDVHGIADTALLETTAGAAAKVTAHTLAADPHGDRAFSIQRDNHSGTQSADTLTDGTTNKAFLATERTKLAGVATGATANSSDATLLARANHTGGQLASTISDFTVAVLAADPDAYTAGVCWPPRNLVTGNGSLTNQGLRLTYFTAPRAETWTSIATSTGTTAAGATPTLCKMGVYLVEANGDLTRVAVTASDTSLWNTPSTRTPPQAFIAPYAAVAGQRYALAALIVTGAALPSLHCADPILPAATLSFAPRLAGVVTGQTDLPTSVVAASVADSGFIVFGEVLTA